MMRFLILLSLICFSLTLSPAPAWAHGVLTDYRLVSDALEIQSTYSTGEAFEGAPVTIYAPNNLTHPWLEGKTDQNGAFQFQPDRAIPGEWSVKIGEAGDHGDILAVPVTAQGVDLNEISQAPFDQPHWLAKFSRQMIVFGLLLSGLGAWWVRRM
jgi:nickel transport protein